MAWTEKDKIIADYSDHDPEEHELCKKAMWKQTQEKLKSMKEVIINAVLNERK